MVVIPSSEYVTREESQKVKERLESKFPIGSAIYSKFDTRRCLFFVREYFYDERNETIAALGDGINGANEVLSYNRFGLRGNDLRLATKGEIQYLLNKGVSCDQTTKPKKEFECVTFMREDLIDHLGEERAMSLTDEEMEAIVKKVGEHILEYYEWQDDLNETADFVLS